MSTVSRVAPQTAISSTTVFSTVADGDMARSPTLYPDDETHHATDVLEAREAFFQSRFGVPHTSVAWLTQNIAPDHVDTVYLINRYDDLGSQDVRPPLVGNGLVTRLPNIVLAVKGADCGIVTLSEQVNGVVAAFHAGWRGVVANIAQKTVDVMVEQGAARKHISAHLGPMLGARCGCAEFDPNDEAGQKISIGFRKLNSIHEFEAGSRLPKPRFDMSLAIRTQLSIAGVKSSDCVRTCTQCDKRYFSARRDGLRSNNTGAIMLRIS